MLKRHIESMLIFGQHFTGETLDRQSLIQHLNMVQKYNLNIIFLKYNFRKILFS